MINGNEFKLEDVSIFLNGDNLHVIGDNEEEISVSLYDLADEFLSQQIDKIGSAA